MRRSLSEMDTVSANLEQATARVGELETELGSVQGELQAGAGSRR